MRNRKLANTILQMAKADQEIRKAFLKDASLYREVEKIDVSNPKKMKILVKKFGWPTISLVGKKASHFAWLLVQHADMDVEFQEHCLALMKKEVESGEVSKADIAYLTDRVLVNKGKKQIYGTQFYRNKAGKLVSKPIKDVANTDRRRREMDMESFGLYSKKLTNSIMVGKL